MAGGRHAGRHHTKSGFLARPVIMLQITPRMRILVALDPADFRRGIDGMARQCQEVLQEDPFGGAVFVFRNRRGTAIIGLSLTARIAIHIGG